MIGGTGTDEHGQVTLIPINAAGDDSFMPSVVVAPIEITDNVATDIDSFVTQLPRSAVRGARVVPGTQQGLYGATGEAVECDVSAAANYLDARRDRSVQWAQAINVAAERIPYYLNTLTPAVLTADTWVTAFAPGEGHPASRQAVLQAGNAVLIDQVGVPRMHCATGNPLGPPANVNLASLAVNGKRWQGFDQQGVIAIAYSGGGSEAPVVDEFVLRNLSTGEVITRPAGKTIDIGVDPTGWSPDPAAMNVPPAS
ncbi:DUF6777 domain-containing protein [Mycobacterium sp. SMC-4]|uniref:DUF6777 domain-containing protein n=1 Tax=Mycobacterium sp. SMC-4 TaxID=2857059 RepID=UPI0021B2566A|nr:DUF6777 domain-containing protein [Mycobacterium sp. SMC-4]UXA19109.1 hypothetical protein KXD98_05515 [Mycobacterium sp. SMC-4]